MAKPERLRLDVIGTEAFSRTLRRPRVHIDIIPTDMLLWSLRAFEEVPPPLPPAFVKRMRELAALPKTPYGELAKLAHRYGMKKNVLHVVMSQLRRHGIEPKSWRIAE